MTRQDTTRHDKTRQDTTCAVSDTYANANANANTTPTPSKGEDLPEVLKNSEKFREVWTEWEGYRRERKKGLTPRSRAAQLKMLAEMGPEKAAECLRKSILQGWTGLFPSEGENGFTKKKIRRENLKCGRRRNKDATD